MSRRFVCYILSFIFLFCFGSEIEGGVKASFYIRDVLKRWNLRVEGAVSWIAMTDLNDYISWINDTWDGNISKVKTSSSFSGEVIYMVTRKYGVGLGCETLSAKASGSSMGGDFEVTTRALGIFGILFIHYPHILGGLGLKGDLGLGYYDAKYTESENGWSQEGNDSSIGCHLKTRIGYDLGRNFSLEAGGGYRILKMDDFGVDFVSPSNPPVKLDYSGWFAKTGIAYSW